MAIKTSTGFAAKLMVTGSAKSVLDLGFLKVYTGAAPTSADDAVTGTLLNTYSVSDGGTGLTFEAAAVGRSMVKTTSETWSGTAAATGTAGYWRFVAVGDDGTSSTTQARVQGTAGNTADSDMFLSDPNFTASVLRTIDAFSIALPTN